MVGAWVQAMTGADVLRGFRGRYKTAAGAKRITGADIGDFLAGEADRHGFPEIPPRMAQRGDVVLIDQAEPAPGVVVAGGVYVVAPSGGKVIPRPAVSRAWRIG